VVKTGLLGKLAIGLALASTSLAAVVTSSAATRTGDWPMFADGPAHDGVNRAETTLSSTTVPGLHVTHTFKNWAPEDYQVISGGLGFSAVKTRPKDGDSEIGAFNLTTGARVWSHEIFACSKGHGSVPAVANGVVYVGGDSTVYAYNATTGTPIWQTVVSPGAGCSVPFYADPVTLAGGVVYAAAPNSTSGESVYAFSQATGALLWTAAPSGCCIAEPVTVSGGIAYVATDHLTAYNATTGALVFSSSVALSFADVATSGGAAFAVTGSGPATLHAFNSSTGAQLWSTAVPSSGGALAVDGNTIVVSDGDDVLAYSASTGTQLWEYISATPSGYSTPSIANGVVYEASFGLGLQAFNEATGAALFASSNLFCIGAVVSQGKVYANCFTSAAPGIQRETVFGL
jgi:outer membrane protein assembly factor BamB